MCQQRKNYKTLYVEHKTNESSGMDYFKLLVAIYRQKNIFIRSYIYTKIYTTLRVSLLHMK